MIGATRAQILRVLQLCKARITIISHLTVLTSSTLHIVNILYNYRYYSKFYNLEKGEVAVLSSIHV